MNPAPPVIRTCLRVAPVTLITIFFLVPFHSSHSSHGRPTPSLGPRGNSESATTQCPATPCPATSDPDAIRIQSEPNLADRRRRPCGTARRRNRALGRVVRVSTGIDPTAHPH